MMEVAEDELMMIVWEGYLKKKTPRGVVKIWQNRYFRLLGDILEYYKSDKLGVASGMIPLQMMTGLQVHPASKKGGCRFDILLDIGTERRVFSLLAPSPQVCEKLVRSIRNMLHHPVDESARMDIANIDLSGQFWKKIDEIERRRAGSSKKVDVAAQFAGFDIKPRRKKKQPTDASIPEGSVGSNGQISPPTTSRVDRERMQAEMKVEEVETPVIRIVKELRNIPVGQLYLARENETKTPYYMHVLNRSLDEHASAGSAGVGAHVDADKNAQAWQDLSAVKELWQEQMKLNHPFLLKCVSNGESADRLWLLYSYGALHSSLQFHIAALQKQRQDALALGILSAPPSQPISQPPPPLSMLLPEPVVRSIAVELVCLLEYIHSRGLVAVNLDVGHVSLTEHGHVQLTDFFLAENKEHIPPAPIPGIIPAPIIPLPFKYREPTPPSWWTPERHRGDAEDARGDAWRLGLILYSLLTGNDPPGFTREWKQDDGQDSGAAKKTNSLHEERKGDSEDRDSSGESKAQDSSQLDILQTDPLTPEQRLKSNILTFDPSIPSHLPFPEGTTQEMQEFIRACLNTSPSRRLGGSGWKVSSSTLAAPSTASSSSTSSTIPASTTASPSTSVSNRASFITTLQNHSWLKQTDWLGLKDQIRQTQQADSFSPGSLLPVAPECVFRSLVHAPHNLPFIRSTIHAAIEAQYKIVVTVRQGRHFRREQNGSAPGNASPITGGVSTDASQVNSKFYIKVLVDGKALKTDVFDSVGKSDWSWNKKMHFSATDASLETDLIARVMEQDQDSFHDATIGSVTIPLRHVYQMCTEKDRTDRELQAEIDSKEQPSAGPITGTSTSASGTVDPSNKSPSADKPISLPREKGFDAWFSVIDRDGFVVGELRLNFQLGGSRFSSSSAVAPVVSRKRFSFLFGSAFSSEIHKEDQSALPDEKTQVEIDQVQLVPAKDAEGQDSDEQTVHGGHKIDFSDRDASIDPVHIHTGPLISRRTSNMTLKTSLNGSARSSMAHLGSLMLHSSPLTGPLPSVHDDPDEDEDEEEDEKLTHTQPTLLSVPSVNSPDRKTSPAPPGRQIGAGQKAPPSPQTSTTATAPVTTAGSNAAAGTAQGGAVGFLRGLVSKKKLRFQEKGFDLDLSYIGERIIAMGFPSEGSEAAYRNPMPQVQQFFKTFHPGAYKVYNLCSERRYDHAKFTTCDNGEVREFPFDDHNCPAFHQIVDLCVDVHAFLTKKADNVVAIHCKAGKGRTGLMISCYLLYSGTCSHADAALTYFATHRTSNGKGVTIPSQLRYVHYFAKYLTNYFDVNRPFPFVGVPLLLTHVRLTGIPKFDLVSGGCDPFFTIFQAERCVFDFQLFKLSQGGSGSRSGASGGLISSSNSATADASSADGRKDSVDHVDFKVFVPLKADCKLLLYERDRLGRSNKIAWFWFHTSFIAAEGSSYLSLTKSEIDGAIKDKESKHFPPHFRVELWFKPPPADFACATTQNENLVELATSIAKVSHKSRLDAEEAAAPESEEITPQPLVLPFDVAVSLNADAICHNQAVQDYDIWQSQVDEACLLFQPEMPPT